MMFLLRHNIKRLHACNDIFHTNYILIIHIFSYILLFGRYMGPAGDLSRCNMGLTA